MDAESISPDISLQFLKLHRENINWSLRAETLGTKIQLAELVEFKHEYALTNIVDDYLYSLYNDYTIEMERINKIVELNERMVQCDNLRSMYKDLYDILEKIDELADRS